MKLKMHKNKNQKTEIWTLEVLGLLKPKNLGFIAAIFQP